MRDTEPAGLLILSGLLSVGGNVVRNGPRRAGLLTGLPGSRQALGPGPGREEVPAEEGPTGSPTRSPTGIQVSGYTVSVAQSYNPWCFSLALTGGRGFRN